VTKIFSAHIPKAYFLILYLHVHGLPRRPTNSTSSLIFLVIKATMDFSNFNPAEQAHMTKVIEKRQVCSSQALASQTRDTEMNIKTDARLPPNVLESG